MSAAHGMLCLIRLENHYTKGLGFLNFINFEWRETGW